MKRCTGDELTEFAACFALAFVGIVVAWPLAWAAGELDRRIWGPR